MTWTAVGMRKGACHRFSVVYPLTLLSNGYGYMFTVNSSVTLTLDENITLVGMSQNNNALVFVSGGNLIMNDGAKIIGNTMTALLLILIILYSLARTLQILIGIARLPT
jgi:hypothetical protein